MADISNNDLIEEVSKTEEGGWSETSMQLTVALSCMLIFVSMWIKVRKSFTFSLEAEK